VNDFAGIIDNTSKTQLTNIITQFDKTSKNELAVVTVPSLEGEPIENYAVALFKKWGIGKKNEDNGLLLLVAPNDKEVRIEVGYGLEPYINDAVAGRIIRDTMIPHFRNGHFGLGIVNGVVELTGIIAKKAGFEFDPIAAGSLDAGHIYHIDNAPEQKESLFAKIFKIIIIVFFVLLFIKNPWAALFILSSFSGGNRGGSFRGGFGGGFSGFGGGMSGGGGASGRW
jgi:uncharacterized protein